MQTDSLLKNLQSDILDNELRKLYGDTKLQAQKKRYIRLVKLFIQTFKEDEAQIFSAPGRTEIGGNHTDHNHGKVLAASIPFDVAAIAAATSDAKVELVSIGFDKTFVVDLNDLSAKKEEFGTTEALIRGVAAGFKRNGFQFGGFKCVIQSDVLTGSGLSSSAALEMVLATIINHFYNNAELEAVAIAKIGQYAENIYFGKPCGLMDQLGCAHGGMISIDFKDPENPKIEHVNISFHDHAYSLMVVDTGGNHADLTDDYASIPKEMKAVAEFFGKTSCRDIDLQLVYDNILQLREKTGDRAILRVLHYLTENKRVSEMFETLKTGDIETYLQLVNSSGRSSFQYLQNIYTHHNLKEQGVSLALALTDIFLKGSGAFRVQGGGFAGTIQVYIPLAKESEYIKFMQQTFGNDCVTPITIRKQGAVKVV